jgi:hypothetical protein
MSSLTAFESCLGMPQPAGAGRPAASCAWTRTACLSGRLSVSRGHSTLPYLLLLSMPRHTSSLSSSHALSSTLRRKTLSRLLSASPISTQKGLSCPRYTRYTASQPIPIIQTHTISPPQTRTPFRPVPNGAKLRGYCLLNRNRNLNPNLDLNLLVENGLRLGLRLGL